MRHNIKFPAYLETRKVLCVLAFVACILLSVAPLSRIPDPVIHLQTPLGTYLARVGFWLPNNVGLTTNPIASRANTNYLVFMILIGLTFVFYGLYALLILRNIPDSKHRQTYWPIWAGTIAAGLIYMFTPAMLSHDILAYVSYSRLLTVYHANPYFVPIAAYPQDPFYHLNYWSHVVTTYGPVWSGISALWGLLPGSQPVEYVLAFRLFALAAHLINTWLVIAILRAMRQSSRTVALGALLYAWNPLVLLESSLGGHNDVFMVTFILVGILLAVCADQRGLLISPQGYLPPIIAFTLAALVKFSTFPLIALFILLLAFRALRPADSNLRSIQKIFSLRWKLALSTVLTAGSVTTLFTLACYAPFWIGHSIPAIVHSFTSLPSTHYAENSVLRALITWPQAKTLPPHTLGNTLVSILKKRRTWNNLVILTLVITILVGAVAMWRSPTIRNFVLATVMTFGAILLVTPFFFSWYVTWLVGLIAVCFPFKGSRTGRALLAFVLAFSASAFLTYLYKDGYPPFGIWTGFVFLTTIAPPIFAFLIVYFTWKPSLPVSQTANGSVLKEEIRT